MSCGRHQGAGLATSLGERTRARARAAALAALEAGIGRVFDHFPALQSLSWVQGEFLVDLPGDQAGLAFAVGQAVVNGIDARLDRDSAEGRLRLIVDAFLRALEPLLLRAVLGEDVTVCVHRGGVLEVCRADTR